MTFSFFLAFLVLLDQWLALQAVSDVGATRVIRSSAFILFLLTTLDGTVTLMLFVLVADALNLEARYILLFPGVIAHLFAFEAMN